jgi:hypothetical protein
MFKSKKINNLKVEDLTPKPIQTDKNPYEDMFPIRWFNMFILARKHSGKTNLIYNILKKIVNKKTTSVFIFCSTVDKDNTWIDLVKTLRESGIRVLTNTSLTNDNPEDQEYDLESVIELMKQPIPEDNSDEDIPCEPILFKLNEISNKKKKNKKKKLPDDFICIFDDLSNELRSKIIPTLLKKNRHYRSRCIISSQYMNDLDPQSIKQMDYLLLLPGQDEEKLKILHKHADLKLDLPEFVDLYKDATGEKYNFLYVETPTQKYRHNFDSEYEI